MKLKNLFSRRARKIEKVTVARERLRDRVVPVWERLHRMQREKGPLTVLFAGCEPEAGVTLVSLSVAESLAQHLRQRVLLVEANVTRPALASYLGLSRRTGLGELLLGEGTESEPCQDVAGHFGLSVISGGARKRERVPGELSSPVSQKFWSTLPSADYTLIDAGTLLGSPDARLLLPRADVGVLVVRSRVTAKKDVQEAMGIFEEYEVPLLGSVMNHYRSDMPFDLDDL